MMYKMHIFVKRLIILALFLFFSFSLVNAQSTYNFLTKGLADTLYCPIDGDCGNNSGGGGSGNVSDVWINETGDTMTGNLTLANENVTINDAYSGSHIRFENGSIINHIAG